MLVAVHQCSGNTHVFFLLSKSLFCFINISLFYHVILYVIAIATNLFFWVGWSVCLFGMSFPVWEGLYTHRRHLYHEVSSCYGKGSVCFFRRV